MFYHSITEFVFLINVLGKRRDLPFSRKSDRKKEKSTVSFTHVQNITCSQTQLDGIAHEQTIICRQLFAGHVVGSRPMKRKKNLIIVYYLSQHCTIIHIFLITWIMITSLMSLLTCLRYNQLSFLLSLSPNRNIPSNFTCYNASRTSSYGARNWPSQTYQLLEVFGSRVKSTPFRSLFQ